MKNKNRSILIGVSLILLIGILVLVFGVQQTIFQASDVTVLGQGDKLLITASVGNIKDNIIVDMDRNQLNSELSGEGWSVDEGVRISMDLLSSKVEWSHSKTDDVYYSVHKRSPIDYPTFRSTSKDNLISYCRANGFPNTVDAVAIPGFFDVDVICYEGKAIATRGQFDGRGEYNYQIRVSAGGDNEIISADNPRAELLGNNIIVRFTNQILSSPVNLFPPPFDILWLKDNPERLIDSGTSNLASLSSVQQFMNSCTGSSTDVSIYDSCRDNWNSRLDNSLIDDKSDDYENSIPEVKSTSLEKDTSQSGRFIADVEPINYPLIEIEVDGSLIGLERLSGQPKLTCPSDQEMFSGENKNVNFFIKNIGSQNGFFQLFYSSQNANVFGTNAVSLNDGESTSLQVRIQSLNEGDDRIETVTINAVDSISGVSDSCSFKLTTKEAETLCEPGKLLCSNDLSEVLVCNQGGSSTSVVETCKSGEQCGVGDDGELSCLTEEERGKSKGFFESLFSGIGDLFDETRTTLQKIIGGLIIGIIILVIIIIFILVLRLINFVRGR